MKDKIEIAIKTLEGEMENLANSIDYLKSVKEDLDKVEVVPHGTWDDINENTPEKRCSNCGRASLPTMYCHGCGSKNTYRQSAQKVV